MYFLSLKDTTSIPVSVIIRRSPVIFSCLKRKLNNSLSSPLTPRPPPVMWIKEHKQQGCNELPLRICAGIVWRMWSTCSRRHGTCWMRWLKIIETCPYWEELCQRSWVRPQRGHSCFQYLADRPRPGNNVFYFYFFSTSFGKQILKWNDKNTDIPGVDGGCVAAMLK